MAGTKEDVEDVLQSAHAFLGIAVAKLFQCHWMKKQKKLNQKDFKIETHRDGS